MSALKSVIITLPTKGLAKNSNNNNSNPMEVNKSVPKLNFTTSILMDKIKVEQQPTTKLQTVKHLEIGQMPLVDGLPIVLKQEADADSPMRGKKRRLDHLTWEEKLQRKKLKNRVAAQTSRDRKKAKLDELEDTVKLLKERNDRLTKECEMLRTCNESLVNETQRLKQDNELLEAKNKSLQDKDEMCKMCQARVDCTVPALGSAVSPLDPLQQGGTVQTARPLTKTHNNNNNKNSSNQNASILMKILTLYLLSKTYLANSKETTTTLSDLKSLPKAFCERLPHKWRQVLLSQMSRLPSKKRVTKNLTLEKKWWGRHQVMWKPMQPMEA